MQIVELVHHGVDGILELQNLAADVRRDLREDRLSRRP
jgi:hypothetical protein